MNTQASTHHRRALTAVGAVLVAATLAACGSSAPATTTPSQAASVAPASVAPPASVAAASPSAVASAPASSGSAVDAAAGLKIDAPYTITALPGALQTTMEQQMAAGLGAFGNAITFGFRQIDGGSSTSILMVLAFPSGTLNDSAYQAALAGMGSSMGATFATTTVDGTDVSTGKASTGGVGVFHAGDHMLVVISAVDTDVLPVATALIKANK